MHTSGIDLKKFAALVRTKRASRGLRAVADEIGNVSASTLSRIEQACVPDLPTFIRICSWLGMSPNEFVQSSLSLKRKTPGPARIRLPESIEAQLRQDHSLPTATVDAISQMIRVAYQAAEANRPDQKSSDQN
jgi:transcriptional regulator with XRE-family HTH domain